MHPFKGDFLYIMAFVLINVMIFKSARFFSPFAFLA